MLDLAARLALRAAGLVEPDPMVGCVLAHEDGQGGARVIGLGHHRAFGSPHAESEAIADARRRAEGTRGATCWCTLEPCNHTGKRPPCSDALIEAGVARVVAASPDTNPIAAGGFERLRSAGVEVDLSDASRAATLISAPFLKRTETGLPWVIAKWAQSVDGRVATRTGASKWISSGPSRRRVHRLRARVDAIMTGVGTVIADDPLLTARGARLRRTAARVVVDPTLRISPESRLVRTAREAPVIVLCAEPAGPGADRLRAAGVTVLAAPCATGELDLRWTLNWLANERGATNVLVESGPGLLGRMIRQDLIDECRVFIAPLLLGDEQALPAASGAVAPELADGSRFDLFAARRSGPDALLHLVRRTV